MNKLLPAMLVVALSCVSCTQRIADLTFASTKNVDMNAPQGYSTMPNARVTGRDMAHIIICFPTKMPSPKEAIDRAIEKNGSECVGLSNAKLESGGWYIPYIYGQAWYEATGDPVYKR